MKRTFAWLIVGILLVPASLLAQRWGSVKGIVTDDECRPLRGATVRVIGGKPLRGDIAALDGTYRVATLRPGTYRMLVTMVGRGPVVVPEVRIRAGRSAVAHFTLTFVPIRYDTVVVHALAAVRPEVKHGALPDHRERPASAGAVDENEERDTTPAPPAMIAAMLFPCRQLVPAQTTGMLKGRVVDEKGRGIPHAIVTVEGTSPRRGAYTREDGSYLIAGIRAGEYDIRTVFPGRVTAVRKNVRISVDGTTTMDVVLVADREKKKEEMRVIERPNVGKIPSSARIDLRELIKSDSTFIRRVPPARRDRDSNSIRVDGIDTVAADSTAPRREP